MRIESADGRVVHFSSAKPSLTRASALRIAREKHLTSAALAEGGVPAPESHFIRASSADVSDVVEVADRIGYPVVIKPSDGGGGMGVFTGIQSADELCEYYSYLTEKLGFSTLVLESHIVGSEELRVLVVGDVIAAACARIPANVVGDGILSIRELIDAKNLARSANPFLSNGPIKLDVELLAFVSRAGYELDSVLRQGERLQLRGKVNADSGGDTVDVTSSLPDEVARVSVAAVRCIPGLFAAGVDILLARDDEGNISRDDEGNICGVTVLELNANPQIAVNMYPSEGAGQDVPKVWIDQIFPESVRAGAPGEETLTFSLDAPLEALETGVADAVTLRPVPSSRLPHRTEYWFSSSDTLSARRRRFLIGLALENGVSGELEACSGGVRLRIAGPNESGCRPIVRRVAKWLSADLTEPKPWRGVVRLGFRVDI
ncbi:ATP-binding protein [Brevibacterium yomogidense]|uniref:ATP-binding protein n=1 Tax=Brevibacterium yomogidense TaxID=946573 RepID=UPI000B34BCB3|nr:hypothetical protein [Brevibacterium yomogidense]